jgi:hypothetical protein
MDSMHIVTTTINPPTHALMLFINHAKLNNGKLFIVGDKRTPHYEYEELTKKYDHVVYLHPDFQEHKYKGLSDTIGWNSIQRRNIGFIEAWHDTKATIIATVDDDNIPYSNWGQNVCLSERREVEIYETQNTCFEPLSVTNNDDLWHRGFPVEEIPNRKNNAYKGRKWVSSPVQADLWDGDPDIDAMCRIPNKPCVKFDTSMPYMSDTMSPFNSQNTFISRNFISNYCVFPHIGRMDDIWGSYVFQYLTNKSPVYAPASVYQDRNEHDLINDLENEVIGYRNTHRLVQNIHKWKEFMPSRTLEFWDAYRTEYGELG